MTRRVPGEVFDVVRHAFGSDVHLGGSTPRGESKSTFLVHTDAADFVVKLLPNGEGVLENQHRLVRIVDRLRDSGYPAPRYEAVGLAGGHVFTVQELLPGVLLEDSPGQRPAPQVFAALLPELLAVIELQAGVGDLADPPWPHWLIDTTVHSGDGYCLHKTMRARSDTSALLDRVLRLVTTRGPGLPRSGDVMHFDLNPANILHDAGRLTGVIDWNVPFEGATQGDRGFDLATLLFYTYDLPVTRDQLWDATVAVSGADWTTVYLAHLSLRQVEWTIRHDPGSTAEDRFLAIANQVLRDCEALSAS